MKIIETERWVPSKEDPSRSEYIGQRTGQEVFEELRQQLENMGCLPDEYFLLDQQWEKGREIPKGADISAPPIMVRVRVFIWMCT